MQAEKQYSYYYDNSNKDRLININGVSISGYDNQGRPANYRGWNLGWKNGRVNTFTKGNVTNTCEYDANGIRFRKIANGLQHEYYLEDNKIVREVVTGNDSYELLYMYGANGIAGFTYKRGNSATNYYYRKNLQGDIVAVYGESGAKYAEYAYDAWGNCKILVNSNGIATLNPYRYRGYYWDSEFGLYYLNARYYDPEVGRFISQDSIKYIAPLALNGLNLFAYCLNNPVSGADPDGTSIFSKIGNWFKKVGNAVKDFFVEDVYAGVIKPAWDWVSGTAAPAVSNFFTETIPDFFVNTVWNDWMVGTIYEKGLKPAWDATANFFTNTIPDFFVNTFWNDWIVDKVWNKGILVAWDWLNGDKWYQSLVKNSLITIITTLIGAVIGGIPGTIIGAVAGILIGWLWDILDKGWNN